MPELNQKGSNLLADLMDRYPFIVVAGSAILAKVAGDMIFADRAFIGILHPTEAARYIVEILLVAILVITANRLAAARQREQGSAS